MTAWIEVDGQRVNIINKQDRGRFLSGFVESNVGAEFALCYRMDMTSPRKDFCARGTVDGSTYVSCIIHL